MDRFLAVFYGTFSILYPYPSYYAFLSHWIHRCQQFWPHLCSISSVLYLSYRVNRSQWKYIRTGLVCVISVIFLLHFVFFTEAAAAVFNMLIQQSMVRVNSVKTAEWNWHCLCCITACVAVIYLVLRSFLFWMFYLLRPAFAELCT